MTKKMTLSLRCVRKAFKLSVVCFLNTVYVSHLMSSYLTSHLISSLILSDLILSHLSSPILSHLSIYISSYLSSHHILSHYTSCGIRQVQGGVAEWEFEGDKDDERSARDDPRALSFGVSSNKNGRQVLTKVCPCCS